MTQEEAIQKWDSEWWKDKPPEEIVAFQLYEERLCMPFGDFQLAVDAAIGRQTWTHEYGMPEAVAQMKREFEAKHPDLVEV
jgi:hypothetical protein